jgi:hypothetical protein
MQLYTVQTPNNYMLSYFSLALEGYRCWPSDDRKRTTAVLEAICVDDDQPIRPEYVSQIFPSALSEGEIDMGALTQ